ncbi:MAG: L-2-amino-thiazoline-4-carboxylic acid hydrolase [Pseudomonadota bacterium]|nr:L-2-amino-thiazoline-4-carboxylic acid hydrolase [Pseudomonadota bacterium]
MPNSILNAIKMQSKMVIPIVRELEKEIGKERAHALVGRAIAGAYVDYRKLRGFEANSHPRVKQEGEDVFPAEREVIDDAGESYGYNITGSLFAEYFRSIGEPEIGALMTCGVDFTAEDLIRPNWEFERTQARMQGASHCDFRWRKGASDG